MSGEPKTPDAGEPDPRLGALLGGKFKVLRVVGRGGMGVVYEVSGPTGEVLAAKVITRGATGSSVGPQEVRRLLREARAATNIVSPNVVRALEVGEDAATGAPFLILELLDGIDLARLLAERAPIVAAPMVRLLRQAARGLAAAHEKGIVHRDVKPANLFLHLEADGRVVLKVCDFGIAKHGLEGRDGASTELTQTGSLLGSPAYMSPEQTQSAKELDARADVWGLAVTAYEALSGRRLWPLATSLGQLILAISTAPIVRLEQLAPWIDAELASVIHRGLERDLDARWASAAAFADALAPFTGGTDEVFEDELVTVAASVRRAFATEGVTTAIEPPKPSSPHARTSREAAPILARGGRGRAWLVFGALVLVAGAFVAWKRIEAPSGGADLDAPRDASRAPACATNRDCVEKSLGKAAICVQATGACAALETPDCRLLAEPGDAANDATIWVGAMLPLTGPLADSYGQKEADMIDLARRDFAETVHGLPPARAGAPRRPLGVVLCDDAHDPAEVATHLVGALHVPAVIGFGRSKEVADLALSHFNPNDVLALAANTSSILRGVPRAPSGQRLVWRTTVNTDQIEGPAMALVTDVAEPTLRARRVVGAGELIRVVHARVANSSGLAIADRVVRSLRFNGKSVAENGDAFREVVLEDDEDAGAAAVTAGVERVAREIASLRPHVVFASIDDALIPSVERAWPAGERFRPFYIDGSFNDEATLAWLRDHPDVARRALRSDTTATTPAVAKLVLRHNQVFAKKMSAVDGGVATYDSFYLLAYAIVALGREPLSGHALAQKLPRLMPPGAPIEVGAAGIIDAFNALESGKNVDLVGTVTTLDFDLEAGEAEGDFEIFCASPSGPASSGLVFRAATHKLEGKLGCFGP